MYVDFKITTWERVEVPEGREEEFKALIEKGEITTSNDMFDIDENLFIQKLDEVDESMTPEENGGSATIEVYEDTEMIWDNKII